ncbi:MAG: EcsC family protein [Cyanobacteria bacterium J06648_16]
MSHSADSPTPEDATPDSSELAPAPSADLAETAAPEGDDGPLGQLWDRVKGTAADVGDTTLNTGKAVSQAALSAGAAVGGAALATGQTAAGAVAKVASTAGGAISTTAGTTIDVLGSATHSATHTAGQLTHWIGQNPLFKPVTKVLKLDWLSTVLDQVDIQKATTEVEKLQAKHPDESPSQIAHRLMVRKATFAAGTGLASSALPGLAAPLLAVDVSFTLSLQAEMVYQIAAAYGLDLKDPARKGEVLAIFGLSVGGTKAVQGGVQYATRAGVLGFLRNIPAAGALIGASTNAAMTYSLGYAACRFYESKVNLLESEAALDAAEQASEGYLESAIAQETIMDQILIHLIAAADPDTPWQDRRPELEQSGLSPASLEALTDSDLPPLADLLTRITPDFAAPLLSRCQQIAKQDGDLTPVETAILEQIQAALSDAKPELEA